MYYLFWGIWGVRDVSPTNKEQIQILAITFTYAAKISYKRRDCRLRPREDWLIFPDTHEAIISKEDFETVRKMLGHKRVVPRHNWKNKPGHENLFAGLVFCKNGHKLSFCPQQKTDTNLDHYKCYHDHRAGDTCSGSH
ncbi:recombinase family protein [Streptococcus equi]|uniref:recombinase family protein n=1 Tax=Streptococcus equi TaxID=1336 RepID=UPI002F2B4905